MVDERSVGGKNGRYCGRIQKMMREKAEFKAYRALIETFMLPQ
jgi:hypothetical protein